MKKTFIKERLERLAAAVDKEENVRRHRALFTVFIPKKAKTPKS